MPLPSLAAIEGDAVEPALAEPLALHRERRRAAREELDRLDRLSAKVANLRVVAFVIAAAIPVAIYFDRLPGWSGVIAAAAAVAYAVLAYRHHHLYLQEERLRIQVGLSERGMARATGAWHQLPEKGERFLSPEHLYAPDLDVFGQGSLFQLMDQTATRAGEERLAAYLSSGADAATVAARQGAVRELAPLIDFREGLTVEGRWAAREKVDPAGFVRWAEGRPWLDALRWSRPFAWVLPAVTLALVAMADAGWVSPRLWLLGILAELAVVVLTRKELGEFYAQLSANERSLARLEGAFARVEAQPFTDPLLRQLAGGVASGGGPKVSECLARFSRLLGFAELRQSGQLHPVINLLTLWDIHWMFRLEAWRREHGPKVRGWFTALAELEALSSLGSFAHDRPHFVFPEVKAGEPCLITRGLGHPLLDRPVRNDVSLPGPRHALLITGSNMSGKTTLVRALGANAVLALAGAPVCADALTLSELNLLTSMRVKDSLERGVSYFYAEVQRLKQVLDGAAAAKGRALFLLDEILLGTNTRERQIASREVLTLLLATGALGAVTTHDLSLAELQATPGAHVRNVHFRDLLVEGRMSFDYHLRDGVVDTTNALRVLRQAGIPVAEG